MSNMAILFILAVVGLLCRYSYYLGCKAGYAQCLKDDRQLHRLEYENPDSEEYYRQGERR